MSFKLIDRQTAGATSQAYPIGREEIPVSLTAVGLASGEDVEIQFGIFDEDTETYVWEDAYVLGSQRLLTYQNQNQIINGPCIIRVIKPVTAGNAGVFMHTRENM